MNKIKVLVLGPGEPNALNSGLGIAVDHIIQYLGQHTALTVIQPCELSSHEEIAAKSSQTVNTIELIKPERISREAVTSEIIRVSIGANISPYFYQAHEQELTEDYSQVQTKTSTIREELKLYTEQILVEAAKFDFDIIYAHDWVTFQAAEQLKNTYNKPLALHVHSLDLDRNPLEEKTWIYDLENSVLNSANAIITVSDFTKNRIINDYGISGKKIARVYNGVQAKSSEKYKKTIPEKIVLFSGRLTSQKGIYAFMKIAEKVFERYQNVRFVMAGDGDAFKTLIEAGAYRKLSSRFHFTGYLDDDRLQELYAISDVYCMPSVSEPFGLTAVEAAVSGLPIVLSKQSGAAEVLNGALVTDYWNIDVFTDHIVSLLENEALAQAVKNKNLEAVQNLSWQASGQQVLEVLQNLASK